VTPLVRPGARVLDVGAGRGELVRALRERGFDAEGIDKEHGADLLHYQGGPFDALLFVSALHHIDPLDTAIDRAASLLPSGGLLIVDDFDVDAVDEPTARFWAGLKRKEGDALAAFRRHHEKHGVIGAAPMRAAIAKRFAIESESRGAYLFRYLHDDEDAGPALAEEQRLVNEGKLRPLGYRLTARRA
jgi:SAM-dependent methyltransferase